MKMNYNMKEKILYFVYFFSFMVLLTGCTYSTHLVHVSDFAPTFQSLEKGSLIESRAEQFVVLGFSSETQYVDQALQALNAQCYNGDIQGITTDFSTAHGFFSWTNFVRMQGLCIKGK